MAKRINKPFSIWKYFGIGAGAGLIGVSGTSIMFDSINIYHTNKTNGLNLSQPGLHLKEGNHRVVITDQFYDLLTADGTTELGIKICIDGVKAAIETLNKYNTGIQFKLCTNAPKLAETYSIEYIEKIDKKDIEFYLTNEDISGKSSTMGETVWDCNLFTKEIKNARVTYKKNFMYAFWGFDKDKSIMYSPKNYVSYTTTLHETMHVMGFDHTDDTQSIMYPSAEFLASHDLTEKDIKMIEKYNEVFYKVEQKDLADNSDKIEKAYTTLDVSNNEELEGLVF